MPVTKERIKTQSRPKRLKPMMIPRTIPALQASDYPPQLVISQNDSFHDHKTQFSKISQITGVQPGKSWLINVGLGSKHTIIRQKAQLDWKEKQFKAQLKKTYGEKAEGISDFSVHRASNSHYSAYRDDLSQENYSNMKRQLDQ